MAEKAEKKSEEKAPAPAAAPAAAGDQQEAHGGGDKKKGGGLFTKMPVLLGVAMTLEAVVLFAGFKFIGGGAKPAQAADLVSDSGGGKSEGKEGDDKGGATVDKKKSVVIKVTEFKAPNKKSVPAFCSI